MDGCHAASHFERNWAVVDEALLHDRSEVVNMAAIEILLRWNYGYEKATALCRKADHWKGAKQQQTVRWELLDRYDPLEKMKEGPAVKSADAAVVETMKEDALFEKYLAKVRAAGSANG
jgi:hypothetical protein